MYLKEYGYIKRDIDKLSGKKLGIVVANGMKGFANDIAFPTRLVDL